MMASTVFEQIAKLKERIKELNKNKIRVADFDIDANENIKDIRREIRRLKKLVSPMFL